LKERERGIPESSAKEPRKKPSLPRPLRENEEVLPGTDEPQPVIYFPVLPTAGGGGDDALEDPGLPDLLRAASILLRHSPRRVKHFLNLLRLRWAVRQKMGPDKMTLELTARLVLLEVVRPTLFRTLADHRRVREQIFHRPSDKEDGVFNAKGPWVKEKLPELFDTDRCWLLEHGADVLAQDWEDVRGRESDPFYQGRPEEEGSSPPLTLSALEALLTGTRHSG
jgi:hypothetical protein